MHLKARIRLGDKDVNDVEFHGRPLWIACREEAAIPVSLREKWRLEVISWSLEQRSKIALLSLVVPSSSVSVEPILALWLAPVAVDGIPELRPGQILTITVHADKRPDILAEGSAVVRPCRSAEDFPQVIYLKSVSNK
jgi:hypothetical protein